MHKHCSCKLNCASQAYLATFLFDCSLLLHLMSMICQIGVKLQGESQTLKKRFDGYRIGSICLVQYNERSEVQNSHHTCMIYLSYKYTKV